MPKLCKKSLLIPIDSLDDLDNYIIDNKVSLGDKNSLLGYMKVIACIEYKNPNYDGKSICIDYVIAERFDGLKVGITSSYLKNLINEQQLKRKEFKQFKIANVYLDDRGTGIHWLKQTDYYPTAWNIYQYADKVWLKDSNLKLCYGVVEEAKTKMTKQQLESIVAKCNLTGTPCSLVDYNTIGVLTPENKIMVYSMQPKIL
jgi:hypothetical protein